MIIVIHPPIQYQYHPSQGHPDHPFVQCLQVGETVFVLLVIFGQPEETPHEGFNASAELGLGCAVLDLGDQRVLLRGHWGLPVLCARVHYCAVFVHYALEFCYH